MAVVCPAERHIPTEFQEIYSIVKGSMSIGQRQHFEESCQLIESLHAHEFMSLRRRLKHNFLPFSAGAKGQRLQTRIGKSLPQKPELDQRESNLIVDLMQLLAMARFNFLTKDEWDLSLSESFSYSMPVNVNWKHFEHKLLTEFWSSSPERRRVRLLLPDVADRCLIFHRGIDVVKASGLFFNEKIDLLLSYVIMEPIYKLWKRIKSKLRLRWRPSSIDETVSPSGSAAAPLAVPMHRHSRVVERKSLRIIMPTVWSVIKHLPRTITLEEPAFKEVVMLYRSKQNHFKKSSSSPSKASIKASARSSEERIKGILGSRNLHLRCFRDIPMADLDMVFPDKEVSLKTSSIVSAIGSIITVLVAVAMTMIRAGGVITLGIIWSAVSLVAARGFQVYSQMQTERSNAIQAMTTMLYDKTSDAQEGSISMLIEDMAEQQLKESVIAYMMLYLSSGVRQAADSLVNEDSGSDGITEERLDIMCEDFLQQHFGLKRDFAAESTVPRLLEWDVITSKRLRGGGIVYTARPIEEVHARLIQQWSKAYEAIGRPPKDRELPLTSLFANPNIQLPQLSAAQSPCGTLLWSAAETVPAYPHSTVLPTSDLSGNSGPSPGPSLGPSPGPYPDSTRKAFEASTVSIILDPQTRPSNKSRKKGLFQRMFQRSSSITPIR